MQIYTEESGFLEPPGGRRIGLRNRKVRVNMGSRKWEDRGIGVVKITGKEYPRETKLVQETGSFKKVRVREISIQLKPKTGYALCKQVRDQTFCSAHPMSVTACKHNAIYHNLFML